MSEKKHIHWIFIAYDEVSEDKTQTVMPVTVTVEGQLTEKSALETAKQMVKRKNYFLQKSYECSACSFQNKYLEAIEKFHA